MPQVIALVVAGAGLYAGYRWASRMISGVKDARRTRTQSGAVAPKDLGTLEYDPQSGVYRPRGK